MGKQGWGSGLVVMELVPTGILKDELSVLRPRMLDQRSDSFLAYQVVSVRIEDS